MSDRSNLIDLINSAQYDPGAIQRAMIAQVEETYTGGLTVVDPSNPFVFLLEASATVGAAAMMQSEVLNRKQYPSNALTFEELYLHMSDKDYIGRFATPGKANITFLIAKEEVIQKAIAIGTGNVRKLTIPRNTRVDVAGLPFTFTYPIDIRVMGHGGLQLVYDGNEVSPIQTLQSNKVDWTINNYNTEHTEYLAITVPLLQYRIDSYNASLNGTTAFKKIYDLQDQYYYCRAWMADLSGNWVEVKTTHSDQVFDPLTPTVLLKVVDNTLQVSIPQVYYTTGKINTELRIDIYTTKGPINQALSSYLANQFVASFINLAKDDNDLYVAPIRNMETMAVYSDDIATGGTNGLTFEQLRARVMRSSLGPNDVPITNAQITSRLEDLGYSTVVNVDNITNRVFLATRQLPKPDTGNLVAGAGTTMGLLSSTLKNLSTMNAVIDNGNRLTLTPDMLYLSNNGVLSIVSDSELATIRALTLDKQADKISGNEYLYSPFHYVLDTTDNTFQTRPYYFDSPDIVFKSFVEDNDTTGLGVNSSITELTRTDTGWKLLVQTDSSDAFKALDDANVFVQLMFKPVGESDGAYLNGTLIAKNPDTNERIYQFDIATNWDVDANHNLTLTNFAMYEPVVRDYATQLTDTFNLIYVVANNDVDGQVTSWIDTQTGDFLLPADVIGVYMESLRLKFGDNMDGLWTRARSVAGAQDYVKYESDIYRTYTENEYQKDPVTNRMVFEIDEVTGKPTPILVHAKGEQYLDDNGNPIILHYAGETMLDENGDPIISDDRAIVRQMDIFLMDGVYYFATAALDVTYRKSVPATLVQWLVDDLQPLQASLLEQTKLYFHPKSTIGVLDVLVGEEQEKTISAAQSPVITFYVTRAVYADADLRTQLAASATEQMASDFEDSVVTRDECATNIKAVSGNDVIAVKVSQLGGADDFDVITIQDDSGRLCIGKKIVAMPDGTLAVADSIDIEWVRHTES